MSDPSPTPGPVATPREKLTTRRRGGLRARRPLLLLGLAAAIAAVFVVRHFMTRSTATESVATEPVTRHDISQTVVATGTVQAIEVVEIKSKASGQILKMPVAIGSVVKTGDLLAQIDPLTVRSNYNQLLAASQAAQANVGVTTAQKKRADELFSREAMTAMDHESAQINAANALATQARAHADLEIARQALADATVRAPSGGTIIEQDATQGMVITSGTSSANGGTTLFKLADLNRIQMQALVGETDVGNLTPDMAAKVTIDAFPNHQFQGHVIKIEPQAVVQQSVTMFPVLIAIENVNGQLLPGMNGEVTIEIATRSQVVAVPLDAVRTMRELPAVAATLGLNADSLRAQVQRQMGARAATRVAGAPDTSRARRRYGARGGAGAAGTGGGARGGAGAAGTGGGAPGAGGGATAGSNASRAQIVIVQTARGLEARQVRLGISDFDYSEVLSGVQEGDVVALLSVAEQIAKRTKQQAQFAQRVGNGLPGSGSAAGGGRGGGGGGGR